MKVLLQFICYLGILSSIPNKQIAAQQFTSLPNNMYGDTINAPFYYGVASGDPLSDRVLIWTKITPTDTQLNDTLIVNWEISGYQDFSDILATGTLQASPETNFTVQTDVTGLSANTHYYYRFIDVTGANSATGRTKTLPETTPNDFQIAVASCSSVFSGYFNAYQRIAQRNEVDLVIHLGDYIYDYADSDEEVRMPIPTPTVPSSMEEWHWRHEYYLLDPDLRAARQQHPWMVIWDNHDLSASAAPETNEAIVAFKNYVPIRNIPDAPIEQIYKKISIGNLVDIFMLDILLYRDIEILDDSEGVIAYSLLGTAQYEWLTNELANSTAKWRLMANQNMMGGWFTNGLPAIGPVPDGPVFDDSSWDGYTFEREMFLNFLIDNSIENNIMLSGDAHISVAMDLSPYPLDSTYYNPLTGEGAIGVEFLPTSISRGNFDEFGLPSTLINGVSNASMNVNPHHVYFQITEHGYGLLHLAADSCVAEYWYSEILAPSDDEILGAAFVVRDGENHWDRNALGGAYVESVGINTPSNTSNPDLIIKNQLFTNSINIQLNNATAHNYSIQLISAALGTIVWQQDNISFDSFGNYHIPTPNISEGLYILQIQGADCHLAKKLLKVHY